MEYFQLFFHERASNRTQYASKILGIDNYLKEAQT